MSETRKLLRSKARAAMQRKGFARINKRPIGYDPTIRQWVGYPRFLSCKWRDFT